MGRFSDWHNNSTRLFVVERDARDSVLRFSWEANVGTLEPPQNTVEALMKLDLPAGVDVEIKAFGKEHK